MSIPKSDIINQTTRIFEHSLDFFVLEIIKKHNQLMYNIKKLSEKLDIEPDTLSHTIDSLLKRGLISCINGLYMWTDKGEACYNLCKDIIDWNKSETDY